MSRGGDLGDGGNFRKGKRLQVADQRDSVFVRAHARLDYALRRAAESAAGVHDGANPAGGHEPLERKGIADAEAGTEADRTH